MIDWKQLIEESERKERTPFGRIYLLPTIDLGEYITLEQYNYLINEIQHYGKELERFYTQSSSSEGAYELFPTTII